VARNSHHWECVAVNETPELSIAQAAAAHSTTGGTGGVCWDHFQRFGEGSLSENAFQVVAGAAVRAELRLADGSVTAILAQNGWIAWFGDVPAADASGVIHADLLAGAVLTGFAADGSVVGTLSLTVP
jgi:hypothetical protein